MFTPSGVLVSIDYGPVIQFVLMMRVGQFDLLILDWRTILIGYTPSSVMYISVGPMETWFANAPRRREPPLKLGKLLRTNELLHELSAFEQISRRFRDQHDIQSCRNGNITYTKCKLHRWAGLPCGAWREGIWPPIDGNTKNGELWLGHATYKPMSSWLPDG